MKQVILFLTTKANEWALNAFYALEQSMQGDADVYLAYHRRGGVVPAALHRIKKLFVFTSDILNDLKYSPIEKDKLDAENNRFPILSFFKEHAEYDYYWLIEDDVRFSGEWKGFFANFASNTADFLTSSIEYKSLDSQEDRWFNLKTGNERLPEKEILKSFNPIYRLSNQAVNCVDVHLRKGWMGHNEVLLSTLLHSKGFLIEGFGGDGPFVKTGNDSKYYDLTSMGIEPVLPDTRRNYLFHPVKEEKVRKNRIFKKNAVLIPVGKDSLHRQLLRGDADFDLHLLIYDDSYNKFCNDSDFVACDSGYKMDMTYRYLHRHMELLDQYEYFFLLDDDIIISTEEVNRLFAIMREYHLKIAQPSLVMSYYTYRHTAYHPFYVLRYTNFVEMMMPCFSTDALKSVLPTFEAKVRWRGIEFHWPSLIATNHTDMAIIDAVTAKHIRPIQSYNAASQKMLEEYLKKYKLSFNIEEYDGVLFDDVDLSSVRSFDTLREYCERMKRKLYDDGLRHLKKTEVNSVLYSLMLNSILWNDKACWDVATKLGEKLNNRIFEISK